MSLFTVYSKLDYRLIWCSRACRLKKKAQHEANKLKLYGLEQEHSMYIQISLIFQFYLLSDSYDICSNKFAVLCSCKNILFMYKYKKSMWLRAWRWASVYTEICVFCFWHLKLVKKFVTERLNAGIAQIKQVLAAKFTAENHENQEELTKHIEKVVKAATSK